LLLPPEHAGSRRPRRTASGRRAAAPPSADPAAAALFEALRARRLELARSERVPPYVVASDRTLRELAELKPESLAELEGIYGIGPAKVARYGKALLAVLRSGR
ncbi:MAG TPA: HRDC domain-containing protein, partial [Gemmatimonadales bacterium]